MCSLLEHCRRHRYLSQSGEELALLLSSLLENLLAYRTITHDESPEHRMSCTVNVLVLPAPAFTNGSTLSVQSAADLCRSAERLRQNVFPKYDYPFSLAELLQRKKEGGHLYSVSSTWFQQPDSCESVRYAYKHVHHWEKDNVFTQKKK